MNILELTPSTQRSGATTLAELGEGEVFSLTGGQTLYMKLKGSGDFISHELQERWVFCVILTTGALKPLTPDTLVQKVEAYLMTGAKVMVK